ncbi:MAG: hypothetical protein PHV93_04665 [Candidatus Pacebacteria bacterium]|nr:hypothetical protein [Candidatus Paceibacterota bacterium]
MDLHKALKKAEQRVMEKIKFRMTELAADQTLKATMEADIRKQYGPAPDRKGWRKPKKEKLPKTTKKD